MLRKSVSDRELSQSPSDTSESTIGDDDSFVRDSRSNPFIPQTPRETTVVKYEPFILTGADQTEKLATSKTAQMPAKWEETILFIASNEFTRS
jgi:hypothetical protein